MNPSDSDRESAQGQPRFEDHVPFAGYYTAMSNVNSMDPLAAYSNSMSLAHQMTESTTPRLTPNSNFPLFPFGFRPAYSLPSQASLPNTPSPGRIILGTPLLSSVAGSTGREALPAQTVDMASGVMPSLVDCSIDASNPTSSGWQAANSPPGNTPQLIWNAGVGLNATPFQSEHGGELRNGEQPSDGQATPPSPIPSVATSVMDEFIETQDDKPDSPNSDDENPTLEAELDELRRNGPLNPAIPYSKLLWVAFMDAPDNSMMLQEVYQWFRDNTRRADPNPRNKGWQNSIRHNLSMNGAFIKRESETGITILGSDKQPTEWVLADWAKKKGVQSTTRYRKATQARRVASAAARSHSPSPSTAAQSPSAQSPPAESADTQPSQPVSTQSAPTDSASRPARKRKRRVGARRARRPRVRKPVPAPAADAQSPNRQVEESGSPVLDQPVEYVNTAPEFITPPSVVTPPDVLEPQLFYEVQSLPGQQYGRCLYPAPPPLRVPPTPPAPPVRPAPPPPPTPAPAVAPLQGHSQGYVLNHHLMGGFPQQPRPQVFFPEAHFINAYHPSPQLSTYQMSPQLVNPQAPSYMDMNSLNGNELTLNNQLPLPDQEFVDWTLMEGATYMEYHF